MRTRLGTRRESSMVVDRNSYGCPLSGADGDGGEMRSDAPAGDEGRSHGEE